MPTIRFTNRLKRHVPCPSQSVEGTTVLEALLSYFESNELVKGYVLDECLKLRPNMTIFIDGQPIVDRNDLGQVVSAYTVIDVIQALSGG